MCWQRGQLETVYRAAYAAVRNRRPLPPCTKSFRGCSVRIGWGGTAKASFAFFVINTAVRVRADWVHRDRQTAGVASRWIN